MDEGLVRSDGYEGKNKARLDNTAVEVLYQIADYLTLRDLVWLMSTSKWLHQSILPALHRRDARGCNHALRWASHYGELGTLRRCLEFGAPASGYFQEGSHPAVSWNLYRKEPGPRVRDRRLPCAPRGDFYDTALITAVRRNQAGAVRVLLAHGANPNQPDRRPIPNHRSCWFPLHWALEGHLVVFERESVGGISSGGRAITLTNRSPYEPRTGDIEILRLLLAAGADPNQLTVEAAGGAGFVPKAPRSSPFSSSSSSLRIAADMERMTPLCCAALPAVTSAKAVDELIRAGADPSIHSRLGTWRGIVTEMAPLDVILTTPPSFLAVSKAEILLSLLVRRRRQQQQQQQHVVGSGTDGAPTLISSYLSNHPGGFLTRVIYSWTPRSWRPGIEMNAILRLLRSVLAIDPAQANAVVAIPADVVPDPAVVVVSGPPGLVNGQTALRLAVCMETTMPLAPLLCFLLNTGADPTAPDVDGATALHYAASFGRLDRLAVLLAGGDDTRPLPPPPDLPDALGWTPLHYAAQFFDRPQMDEQASIAAMLLRAGANPQCRTHDGLTPLDIAFRAGNVGVARVLLRVEERKWTIDEVRLRARAPIVVHSKLTAQNVLYELVHEGGGIVGRGGRRGGGGGGDDDDTGREEEEEEEEEEENSDTSDAAEEGAFIGPRQFNSIVAATENLVVHVRRGVRTVARLLGVEVTAADQGRCRFVLARQPAIRYNTLFISARCFAVAVEEDYEWEVSGLEGQWEEDLNIDW